MRRSFASLALTLVLPSLLATGCSKSSGTVGIDGVLEAEQEITLDGTVDKQLALSVSGNMIARLDIPAGAAPGGTVVKATLRSGLMKQGAAPSGNRVVVLGPSTITLNQPAILNMTMLPATPRPGKLHKVLFAREGDPAWTIKDLTAPPPDDTKPLPAGLQALIDAPGVWGIVEVDGAAPTADAGATRTDGAAPAPADGSTP